MATRGIDIANRSSKRLGRFTRTRFDRVITLCDKVREICPEFPGHPEASHWSMTDPASEPDADSLAPFERAADEIDERVELLLSELRLPPEGIPHVRR